MKRSILPLTLLLSALGAAAACAQVTSIRFAAPVNPIAGLPKYLPSPLTGPLAGTGITLPNLGPSLTPSLTLAAVFPADLPARIPARDGRLPAVPVRPARDVVRDPLRQVMPGVIIRFDDPVAPSKPDASKGKLDKEFDGEGAPSKPVVPLPRRTPVSPGRHISLPEKDLERELGI